MDQAAIAERYALDARVRVSDGPVARGKQGADTGSRLKALLDAIRP